MNDERHIAEAVAAEYVSVPTQIKAIRYMEGENNDAVRQFSVSSAAYYWRELDPEDGEGIYDAEVFDYIHGTWIPMSTGQWVIRGTKGELYPCDDEVFRQKYQRHSDGQEGAS